MITRGDVYELLGARMSDNDIPILPPAWFASGGHPASYVIFAHGIAGVVTARMNGEEPDRLFTIFLATAQLRQGFDPETVIAAVIEDLEAGSPPRGIEHYTKLKRGVAAFVTPEKKISKRRAS